MAGRAGRVCRALRAAQQPPLVRTMHPFGKERTYLAYRAGLGNGVGQLEVTVANVA